CWIAGGKGPRGSGLKSSTQTLTKKLFCTGQAPEAALHPEVVVMAPQTTAQRGVLHLHVLVPVAPAPGVDGPNGRPRRARRVLHPNRHRLRRVRRQYSVNPRKSKVAGPFPPCCPPGG